MRLWLIAALFLSLLAAALPIHAQETPVSLLPGENQLGEITRQNTDTWFTFTSAATVERPVTITVRSVSAGFAPVMLIYDARDALIMRFQNPAGIAQQTYTFMPVSNTRYTIQILSANGGQGQFVISLIDPGFEPEPPFEIVPGTNFTDRVTIDNPVSIYSLVADSASSLMVSVTSTLPDGGPAIVFSDAEGNPLGMFSQQSRGGSFILPPAVGGQLLVTVIHSGAERVENYQITVSSFNN